PLAVLAAESGFTVVGIDTDANKVATLARGRSPIQDISDARLQATLASGTYRPSVDISTVDGFDYAVISVPTPLRNRQPNLEYVENAAAAVAPYVTSGSTVILESTT